MLLCRLMAKNLETGKKHFFYTRIVPAHIKKIDTAISDSKDCIVLLSDDGKVIEIPELSVKFDLIMNPSLKAFLGWKASTNLGTIELFGIEKFGDAEERLFHRHNRIAMGINVSVVLFMTAILTSGLWLESL